MNTIAVKLLYFWGIATFIGGQLCIGSDVPTIGDVIAAQREYFLRIQTVDCRYSVELDTPLQSTRLKSQWAGHIQISGPRFRLESGPQDPRNPDEGEILAFDLKQHQQFRKKGLTLRVHAAPPVGKYGGENLPLLQAFEPIIPDVNKRTFDALSETGTWTQLLSNGKVERGGQVEGHSCWAIIIPLKSGGHYRWLVAEDLGLYPISYELYRNDGTLASRYSVKGVHKVAGPQGAIVIPVDAAYLGYGQGEAQSTTSMRLMIDKDTLAINQPIDPTIFTLPRALARSYEDVDNPAASYFPDRDAELAIADTLHNLPSGTTGGKTDQGKSVTSDMPERAKSSDPSTFATSSWMRVPAVSVGIVVIVAVAVWIWFSRRRQIHT